MKHAAWIVVGMLVNTVSAPAAWGADAAMSITGGQRDLLWPRWQARVGWTQHSDAESLRATRDAGLLLGDYYLTRGHWNAVGSGGLRATGGLLLGASAAARTSALADSSVLRSGQGLNFSLLRSPRGLLATEFAPASLGASPYLGLGWSSDGLASGWGLSADLGMTASRRALTPTGNSRTLDELLRELRFAPVVNLGVSYSF
jgi:hypothetical protein